MAFSDYLIGINDVRFDAVWDLWSSRICFELVTHPIAMNYYEQLVVVARTNYPQEPQNLIPKDIYAAVRFMESHPEIDTYWIGYDQSYCSFELLNHILIAYLKRRRRFDFTVGCNTAFGITNKLNHDLLDDLIPNLNIMSITFFRNHQK